MSGSGGMKYMCMSVLWERRRRQRKGKRKRAC